MNSYSILIYKIYTLYTIHPEDKYGVDEYIKRLSKFPSLDSACHIFGLCMEETAPKYGR
jgi:hypothetical protein